MSAAPSLTVGKHFQVAALQAPHSTIMLPNNNNISSSRMSSVVRSTKKQGSVVGDQAREVIQNVIRFFDDEAKYGSRYHIKQATKRAASATGRSERLIKAIRKEIRNNSSLNNGNGMVAVSPAAGAAARKQPLDSLMTNDTSKKKKKLAASDGKALDRKSLSLAVFTKDVGEVCICLIRRLVLDFYASRNEVPTFRKVWRYVAQELASVAPTSAALLRRTLRNMGFVVRRTLHHQHQKALVEKSDIVQWRSQFLRLLRMNATCPFPRPTVYVDEMEVYLGDSGSGKVDCCMSRSGAVRRRQAMEGGGNEEKVTVIDAAGRNGFIPGTTLVFNSNAKKSEYCGEMTSELFEKWLVEKLIPNFSQPTILVMDNARCHTGLSNPVPNCKSSKGEIQQWLVDNGIHFEPDSRKQELLYLVEIHKPPKSYRVEELLQQTGHSVVWLPPHHCDLNVLRYAWTKVKSYVAARRTPAIATTDILSLVVTDALASLRPADIAGTFRHVEQLQEEYWQRDALMEAEIERLGINAMDAGSDEEEDLLLDDDDEGEEDEGGVECKVTTEVARPLPPPPPPLALPEIPQDTSTGLQPEMPEGAT